MSAPAGEPLELKAVLAAVVDGRDLTTEQMAAVVGQFMDGQGTPAQIAALLTGLRMKGETVDEVVGAARAMRARMLRLQVAAPVFVDTCGTGGDGSGSVNVSTLAAFIVAGAGVPVAKHGNRALSSRSGSHDVIEALGIDPAPAPALAASCLERAGLAFLFAPLYHAATRHVAGVRKDLGFRTVFNLLGPLTNPGGARHHVTGVFAAGRVRFVAEAHGKLGSRRALVVHGAGGIDEIATRGATKVAELREDGSIAEYELGPADFGLSEEDPAGLKGGEPAVNARLLREALDGAAGSIRSAALMTAAAALYVTGTASDLRSGTEQATAALDSGRARDVLVRLQETAPLSPKAA